jgi:hypothetical protein
VRTQKLQHFVEEAPNYYIINLYVRVTEVLGSVAKFLGSFADKKLGQPMQNCVKQLFMHLLYTKKAKEKLLLLKFCSLISFLKNPKQP